MMKAGKPTDGKRRSGMAFPEEIARAGQLERDGKPEEADNIYRDILSRDPDHVEAIRLLAALAKLGRGQPGTADVGPWGTAPVPPELCSLLAPSFQNAAL